MEDILYDKDVKFIRLEREDKYGTNKDGNTSLNLSGGGMMQQNTGSTHTDTQCYSAHYQYRDRHTPLTSLHNDAQARGTIV